MVLRKTLFLLALIRAAAIITIYTISPYCFIWIQGFSPHVPGIGTFLIPLLTSEVVVET